MRAMRVCIGCSAEYLPTGNSSRCRECTRNQAREWRARRKAEGRPVISSKHDPAKKQAYSRDYYSRPGPRAERAAYQRRRYRNEAERQKFDARQQTKDAIRRGELIPQPCETCGVSKVDAHHDDYTKPLAVRWLCRKHHSEHHKAAKGEA